MKKKITRAISVALVMLSVMVMCAVGTSAETGSQRSVRLYDSDVTLSGGIYTYTITAEEYFNLVDLAILSYCNTKTIEEVQIKVVADDLDYTYRLYLPHSVSHSDSIWIKPQTGAYTLKYYDSTNTLQTVNVPAPSYYSAWKNVIIDSSECIVDGCGGAMAVQHFRPATCTESGYYYYTCDLCDGTETDKIIVPAVGHYTVNGVCARCSESYTCTSHTWTYDSISDTHHQQVCGVCATKGSTSEHTWNAGVVIKQPTIDSNGIRLYRCYLCSTTRTETIDYLDVDAFIASLTESQALQVYEKLFEEYHTYFLNYMDYDARFEKMSDAKAAQIFKQMFFYGSDEDYGKFQQKLTEDLEIGYWYDRYFATEIFPDIAKNGAQSVYYNDFKNVYYKILENNPSNSIDYQQGYNDAMHSVIDENPIQGLFQSMWSSVVLFVVTVANGVGIGGITLMSVLITVLIIAVVFIVIKLIGAFKS